MADLDNKITLELNADELLKDLDKVEKRANEVELVVDGVKKESKDTYKEVMGAIKTTWMATQAMVGAAGGSIDTVFRSIISAGISAASILIPIFTAQELVPGFQITATIGLAEIAASTGAIIAAALDQTDLATSFSVLSTSLTGFGGFLDSMDFS